MAKHLYSPLTMGPQGESQIQFRDGIKFSKTPKNASYDMQMPLTPYTNWQHFMDHHEIAANSILPREMKG